MKKTKSYEMQIRPKYMILLYHIFNLDRKVWSPQQKATPKIICIKRKQKQRQRRKITASMIRKIWEQLEPEKRGADMRNRRRVAERIATRSNIVREHLL